MAGLWFSDFEKADALLRAARANMGRGLGVWIVGVWELVFGFEVGVFGIENRGWG